MSRVRVMMVAAACLTLAACGGGGGSNDQGVSFRAIGMFQEEEKFAPEADIEIDPEAPIGDTGRIISLAQTVVIANDVNGDGDADGGYIGLENNLDMAINVQGATVEIVIPGASIPNPVVTDFVPMALTLQKVTVDDQGIRTSDRQFAQTFFVRSNVMAFLNQNQNLWPPTPFNMTVVLTVTGIAETGDSFDTNEFTYSVIVQP